MLEVLRKIRASTKLVTLLALLLGTFLSFVALEPVTTTAQTDDQAQAETESYQGANANILDGIFPSCKNAAYSAQQWTFCVREIVNWLFIVALLVMIVRIGYIIIVSLVASDGSTIKKIRESISHTIIGMLFVTAPVAILNLVNSDFGRASFSALAEFATGDSLEQPALSERDCTSQCQDYNNGDSYYAAQACVISCQKSPENAAYYKNMFPGSEPCEVTPEYQACEAGCRSSAGSDGLAYFSCLARTCDLSNNEHCLGLCDSMNQFYLGDETCAINANVEEPEEEEEPEQTQTVFRFNVDLFGLFPACANFQTDSTDQFGQCINQVTQVLLYLAIIIFVLRVAVLFVLWGFSFGGAKQVQYIKETLPDMVVGVVLVAMPLMIMWLISPTSNLLTFQKIDEFFIKKSVLVDVTPPAPIVTQPEPPKTTTSDMVDLGISVEEGSIEICSWGGSFETCTEGCQDKFDVDSDSPECLQACRHTIPAGTECAGLPFPCTYGAFEVQFGQCIMEQCSGGVKDCIEQCRGAVPVEGRNAYRQCEEKPYN